MTTEVLPHLEMRQTFSSRLDPHSFEVQVLGADPEPFLVSSQVRCRSCGADLLGNPKTPDDLTALARAHASGCSGLRLVGKSPMTFLVSVPYYTSGAVGRVVDVWLDGRIVGSAAIETAGRIVLEISHRATRERLRPPVRKKIDTTPKEHT